jgi:hypothetical protein
MMRVALAAGGQGDLVAPVDTVLLELVKIESLARVARLDQANWLKSTA